jgi:hypothetical protein
MLEAFALLSPPQWQLLNQSACLLVLVYKRPGVFTTHPYIERMLLGVSQR